MGTSKPFILFITGISTSGKTTLYDGLKKYEKFKEISTHDIDESGVPDVGRAHWRKFRVEELTYDAIKRCSKGQSSIICGITKPHEVYDFEHVDPDQNIHFILCDISMDTYDVRMRKRLQEQDQEDLVDYELNRAANKKLKQVLHNNVSALRNGFVLNAEKYSKADMIKEGQKLVTKILN